MPGDDGARLLTTDAVGELLRAAVSHAGGTLASWALDHVDANPHQSTTATYTAVVDWPYGRRDELLGVSARTHGPSASDAKAEIFADGDREVAVWLYPHDPDLPGLVRAAYPESMAAVLNAYKAVAEPVAATDLELEMIAYRPRRRAVLRVAVEGGPVFFVKVLRERAFADVTTRHRLLLDAGVPAPGIAAATSDFLLVLHELPGRPLATAVFDAEPPCSASDLIGLLDALPPSVARLPRRPPWAESVDHYSRIVASAVPSLAAKLSWITDEVTTGLVGLPVSPPRLHAATIAAMGRLPAPINDQRTRSRRLIEIPTRSVWHAAQVAVSPRVRSGIRFRRPRGQRKGELHESRRLRRHAHRVRRGRHAGDRGGAQRAAPGTRRHVVPGRRLRQLRGDRRWHAVGAHVPDARSPRQRRASPSQWRAPVARRPRAAHGGRSAAPACSPRGHRQRREWCRGSGGRSCAYAG